MTPLEEHMLDSLTTTLGEQGVSETLIAALRVMYENDRLPTADAIAQAIRVGAEEAAG